jgi:hypothetical protein
VPYTVLPLQISVTPPSFIKGGGTVSFTGSGFASGGQVNVTANGVPVATVTADNQGNITGTITAPTTAGPVTIAAVDVTTGHSAPTATLNVIVPQISLPVLSVVRGTPFTITGSGFVPNGSVNIIIGGQTVATVTANAQGNINASVTLPNSFAIGSAPVVAVDATTGAPTSPIAITVS